MRLKNKYAFSDQVARFSVIEAVVSECRSWDREGVLEETRTRVDNLIRLFGQTVQALADKGVIDRADVEGILTSFEVVE